MKLKKPLLVLLAVFGYCQFMFSTPIITMPSSATFTVGNYGKVEIPFNLNAYANPYDPNLISAYCEFWSPTNAYYKVNAFYYSDFTRAFVEECDPDHPYDREILTPISHSDKWLIRFTPNETGVWRYKITATDAGGTATFPSGILKLPNFSCVASSNQGFIVRANNRFLKRTTGEFFFPTGINLGSWNRCGGSVYGANEYEYYLNNMSNKANLMRVWLDYYDGNAIVGFDQTTQLTHYDLYDQEDAWRLDRIFEFAKAKNVNIQLCFFTHGSWGEMEVGGGQLLNWWPKNPFNSDNGGPCDSPSDFFSNPDAKKKTKEIISYIVARWGHSTNLMAWELWNEVNQITLINPPGESIPNNFFTRVENWHGEMHDYIQEIDVYKHLITSSWGGDANPTSEPVFDLMDYSQNHSYQNLPGDYNDYIYNTTITALSLHNDKPVLTGEWGYYEPNLLRYYDPHGFWLHSVNWSSAFSTSMGASCFWHGDLAMLNNLWHHFKPVKDFMNAQPIPSDQYMPLKNENTNGFRVHYMVSPDLEPIYGWVQDVNFQFTSLFNSSNPLNPTSYLQTLDPTAKPARSSTNNYFYIQAHPNRTYIIEWYSSETGLLSHTTSATSVGSQLMLTMPENLRRSAYGDAVFKAYLDCNVSVWRDGAMSNTPNTNVAGNVICNKATGQVFYKSSDNRIHSNVWNATTQSWDWSNLNNAAGNVAGDLVISPDGNTVYYRTLDNKIKCIYLIPGTNNWTGSSIVNGITNAVGPLVVAPNNQVFYCATDNKIRAVSYNFSTNAWVYDPLAAGLPANCGNSIAIGPGTTAGSFEVFYKTTDFKINSLYKNVNVWTWSNLNNTATGVTSNIAVNSLRQVFYTTADNKMHQIYWGSGWLGGAALPFIPANVGGDIMVGPTSPTTEVFYRTTGNGINSVYNQFGNWNHSALNNCLTSGVVPGWISGTDFSSIYYRFGDIVTGYKVRRIYLKSQCFTTPSPNFDKNLEITDSEEGSSSSEMKEAAADIQLFPNPASNKLTINSSELIAAYAIYNISGEQLMQKDEVNEVSQELLIEKLSNGVYFAQVYLKTGEIIFRKFVVNHEY